MHKVRLTITGIILLVLIAHLEAQDIYWETPKEFLSLEARFPLTASGGGTAAVLWHEFVLSDNGGGKVYLSISTRTGTGRWKKYLRFAGPFVYERNQVPISSLTVDSKGDIYVAVAVAGTIIRILHSVDAGASFKTIKDIHTVSTAVAPRLFLKADGGFLLFVTHETKDSLSIYYSISKDGREWGNFRPFVNDEKLFINYLPYHVSFHGREYVVFQSVTTETIENYRYQLYLKTSNDGGKTWSPAKEFNFKEYRNGTLQEQNVYSNQRPNLEVFGDRILITWERQYRSLPPQIYYTEFNERGEQQKELEMVTEGLNACHFPQLIIYRKKPYIIWFDNRRGEDHIIIASKSGFRWEDRDISKIPGESSFGRPVFVNNTLFVFWENDHAKQNRIYFLEPDRTVLDPRLRAENITPGSRSRKTELRIRWILPKDSSGIAGVDYEWINGPPRKIKGELKITSDRKQSLILKADKDGLWTFNLSAMDYAGNWSKTVSVSYIRDTEPPEKVTFNDFRLDKDGFLVSNTFTISWEPPKDFINGYTYTLKYIAENNINIDKTTYESLTPPARLITKKNSISYRNLDNGIYGFAVSAVDSAGNIGKPRVALLKLNKYIPVTYISYVKAKKDEFGNVNVSIAGRGFSEGGLVSEVILDRDGKKPYDYAFAGSAGAYKVESDRLIDKLTLTDIEEGVYRIGVIHPKRGLHFTGPELKLEPQGTVKFGYFNYKYKSPWEKASRILYFISLNEIVVWIIVVFLSVLIVFAARKLFLLVNEGRVLKREITYIMYEQALPVRKEKKMAELKRKGMGLRSKFVLLIVILVFLIVLIVAIPLGYYMIETQRKDLTTGLTQRVEVLLNSLDSGSAPYLVLKDKLELANLPDLIKGMDEAKYATITDMDDKVWATNDPDIAGKVVGGDYRQAESVIKDEISPLVPKLSEEINKKARATITDTVTEIDKLSTEAKGYALKNDTASRQKLVQLQDAIAMLSAKVNKELRTIGAQTGSIPKFDPQNVKLSYIFYKPIVFRQPREDFYYHGLVRLAISTERINGEIISSRNTLILQTGIIALIAVVLGIIGAIVLASIIVTPIKKLAVGVAKIRDTDDKEALKNHRIDIKSGDEIGTLADTVNQMTQGLVKAAIASKDLTVGKEIQKMFIPLTKDKAGKKTSTGGLTDNAVEIFGYYEGAKGVSGDYFDYNKLDKDNYAIIKCDVAGKGVPASLIMVEVATIFSTFFKSWSGKNPAKSATDLVYLINDMLEERGFKGRFAALTVCILNGTTGNGYFCNAGDNVLHIYDNAGQRMKQLTLPEAPAAGVFPSMLVEAQAGFKTVLEKMERGDILFLFTDGLEEAKRHFRDEKFNITVCNEPGLKEGELHGNTHTVGSDNEELGIPRIHEVINAVLSRRKYSLYKYHNPIPDETLTFDFSRCEGNVSEAVLALISIERIFRIYPDPKAGETNRIFIDEGIDEFLQDHFDQYADYFSHRIETDEMEQYIGFSHLKEDEQYDDLTLLAVKKK
ncbi:MAG: SpoIIE family protein phosphatase [Spirochaetales bacterium]|nr:SpoIIE family protein phosphatase [Spirochaetales bacterium]